MNRSIKVCSWNVRGLNDPVKCGNVLSELLSANPDIVLLQETKLHSIPPLKLRSFLPRRLDSFLYNPAVGTAGGILTAWCTSVLLSNSASSSTHTLTSHLVSTASNTPMAVTNVYAPSTPELRPSFLDELRSLTPHPDSPWMLFGDFNMIRYPHEKNNQNFHHSEAEAFNDCLNAMCLIELPLLDRRYTWTNNRDSPTLERLDRAFINLAWDAVLPNTTLSSLTRHTSDHVPLLVNVSTHIPQSKIFRFENYWIHCSGFRGVVEAAWRCRTPNSDPACLLAAKLKETRRALKLWRKQQSNLNQQEHDCKIVINLIDRVEERRLLSPHEASLRTVVVTVLGRTTNAKLLLWKQRAKIRAAVEGDENTRFFHACANQRRRRNNIQVLEHNGCEVHGHEQKAAVLHSFYLNLLGTSTETTWDFDLNGLYPDDAQHLAGLDGEFEPEEIRSAFRNMHSTASPGPDGFGSLFFKHSWTVISADITALFSAFHMHSVDLERINRSYLVLLPKKEGARRPHDFRPIALQNSTVKSISRVLMNRLQPFIPSLIGTDQSGFVSGRCIADSFVYAADLLNCCYRRGCPTVLMKLDFHKAFDCVAWDSLTKIMKCRGFSDRWCAWINVLLSTGKTTVLLNSVPGNWINCRRGLRQGDPLSPYLFIIVADVLRRLLQNHHLAADIRHPILPDEPCPVLQYADDTLVFMRCTPNAISATKRILQLFEKATGLAINYHKTTFLPIAVPDDEAAALATSFGTTTSTFPQTYLGLPLTPHKVSVSDCLPLITSCDKYLSGWRASLLNRAGRLTLCTSVLSALPLHYMSAISVPKTVLKAIDKRRRAFFWTGEDSCHGSKCLVAWDTVQAPKNAGGLGIKDLELQNRCLLMKFVNKLFSGEQTSWKDWLLRSASSFDTPISGASSFLWRIVNDELNTFRSITIVKVNNGAATSFWFDHWLPAGPLFSTHHALFTHTTMPNISVQRVFQSGFDLRLRPRLTNAASHQLGSLLSLLQEMNIGDGPDLRLLKLTGHTYSARDAYAALDSSGDHTDTHGGRVWRTRLPNKVKVFAWLYFKDRLSTRVNLHAKHIVDGEQCERCARHPENRRHVFFGCEQSDALWTAIGMGDVGQMTDDEAWEADTPANLEATLWPFIFLTILWRIWDGRNGYVFRNENFCNRVVLSRVCDDLVTWRKRLPPELGNGLLGWYAHLRDCTSNSFPRPT